MTNLNLVVKVTIIKAIKINPKTKKLNQKELLRSYKETYKALKKRGIKQQQKLKLTDSTNRLQQSKNSSIAITVLQQHQQEQQDMVVHAVIVLLILLGQNKHQRRSMIVKLP